jgi:hypothetical protein
MHIPTIARGVGVWNMLPKKISDDSHRLRRWQQQEVTKITSQQHLIWPIPRLVRMRRAKNEVAEQWIVNSEPRLPLSLYEVIPFLRTSVTPHRPRWTRSWKRRESWSHLKSLQSWDSRDFIGSTQSRERATVRYVFLESFSGRTWLAETAPRSPRFDQMFLRDTVILLIGSISGCPTPHWPRTYFREFGTTTHRFVGIWSQETSKMWIQPMKTRNGNLVLYNLKIGTKIASPVYPVFLLAYLHFCEHFCHLHWFSRSDRCLTFGTI